MDEADTNTKITCICRTNEAFKLPTISETSCQAWKLQTQNPCVFVE